MYQYNPYMGNQMQQYGAQSQIIKVNGEPGAQAFQLPANSSALLLDSNNPIVYLVQTDGAGYKSVSKYKIEPYQPDPEPDWKAMEIRLQKLEEKINESNTTGTEQNRQYNADNRPNQGRKL